MRENSSAIAALLNIMDDEENAMRSRLSAAEQILSYENPDEAVQLTKDFLRDVFDGVANPVELRLDALKMMRKTESRKAAPPGASADAAARREQWRSLAISHRRLELSDAGLWPAPKGWADDLRADDWMPPQGDPIGSAEGFADRLEIARKAHAPKLTIL